VAKLEGWWEIETSAGQVWSLTYPELGITRLTGSGMPSASQATQRTPTQHGSAWLGFALDEREILIGLLWKGKWSTCLSGRRRQVYQPFSYLAGPLTIRRILPNQEVRELRYCRFGGGLEGDSDDQWDDTETSAVRLVAYDPTWYDPSPHSCAVAESATITDLVTLGDWYSYPTITIGGPCSSFELVSATTGQRLRLTYGIADGEIATLVTNPHCLSATLGDGTDLEPYIPPGDDFGGFCLWPKPLAVTNEWVLTVAGTDAGSTFAFSWEDRYQGI